jgi:hypothetical protein
MCYEIFYTAVSVKNGVGVGEGTLWLLKGFYLNTFLHRSRKITKQKLFDQDIYHMYAFRFRIPGLYLTLLDS